MHPNPRFTSNIYPISILPSNLLSDVQNNSNFFFDFSVFLLTFVLALFLFLFIIYCMKVHVQYFLLP